MYSKSGYCYTIKLRAFKGLISVIKGQCDEMIIKAIMR